MLKLNGKNAASVAVVLCSHYLQQLGIFVGGKCLDYYQQSAEFF